MMHPVVHDHDVVQQRQANQTLLDYVVGEEDQNDFNATMVMSAVDLSQSYYQIRSAANDTQYGKRLGTYSHVRGLHLRSRGLRLWSITAMSEHTFILQSLDYGFWVNYFLDFASFAFGFPTISSVFPTSFIAIATGVQSNQYFIRSAMFPKQYLCHLPKKNRMIISTSPCPFDFIPYSHDSLRTAIRKDANRVEEAANLQEENRTNIEEWNAADAASDQSHLP